MSAWLTTADSSRKPRLPAAGQVRVGHDPPGPVLLWAGEGALIAPPNHPFQGMRTHSHALDHEGMRGESD